MSGGMVVINGIVLHCGLHIDPEARRAAPLSALRVPFIPSCKI